MWGGRSAGGWGRARRPRRRNARERRVPLGDLPRLAKWREWGARAKGGEERGCEVWKMHVLLASSQAWSCHGPLVDNSPMSPMYMHLHLYVRTLVVDECICVSHRDPQHKAG